MARHTVRRSSKPRRVAPSRRWPRCHLPSMPSRHSLSRALYSAIVVSFAGNPLLASRRNVCGATPVRTASRPVSSAAPEGEHSARPLFQFGSCPTPPCKRRSIAGVTDGRGAKGGQRRRNLWQLSAKKTQRLLGRAWCRTRWIPSWHVRACAPAAASLIAGRRHHIKTYALKGVGTHMHERHTSSRVRRYRVVSAEELACAVAVLCDRYYIGQ